MNFVRPPPPPAPQYFWALDRIFWGQGADDFDSETYVTPDDVHPGPGSTAVWSYVCSICACAAMCGTAKRMVLQNVRYEQAYDATECAVLRERTYKWDGLCGTETAYAATRGQAIPPRGAAQSSQVVQIQ
eukprot:3691036-Rhodomonas_salina.1